MQPAVSKSYHVHQRIRLWYALLLLLMVVFLVRLFYLQIIQHGHYSQAALAHQLKEYEIPASRGIIKAYNGDAITPLVLNQTRYTLFADPKFIKNPEATAAKVQKVIGGNVADYEKAMRAKSRYAVLAKKLDKNQKKQIDNLKLRGIGTRDTPYRIYPEAHLAAQLLGFVNDEGEGKYGVEQALNKEFKGTPGQLRAITDAQGVPLVANKDNVVIEPKAGKDVVLTVDIGMQAGLEELLKQGLDQAKSKSGSALILEADTGAIKAMANYPTYNPGEFYKIEDGNVFNNAAVSAPLEVGSIMKTLTAAAALDQKVVSTNTSYHDPSKFVIDGYTIKNIEEDGGPGTHNLADILQLSLNTGATWLLMQMGGGQINSKARNAWHNYLVDHYRLSKPTGVEQGYEASGNIPDPNEGFGLNLQYANTAFGQGMTATPLQMAAALGSVVNGGTYYRPRLVDQVINNNRAKTAVRPQIVRQNVVKPEVGQTVKQLMEYVVQKNHALYKLPQVPAGYSIGGKTGTAEVPKPQGGYYDDRFNGTFLGFVGGDRVQYVIFVRVNEPGISGYAGAGAAAPIFSQLSMMLINNFNVTPRGTGV